MSDEMQMDSGSIEKSDSQGTAGEPEQLADVSIEVTLSNPDGTPDLEEQVVSSGFDPGFESVTAPLRTLLASDSLADRTAASEAILAGTGCATDPYQEYYIELVPEAVRTGGIEVSDDFVENLWWNGVSGGVLSKAATVVALAQIAPDHDTTIGMIRGNLTNGFEDIERSSALVALQSIPDSVREQHADIEKLAAKVSATLADRSKTTEQG